MKTQTQTDLAAALHLRNLHHSCFIFIWASVLLEMNFEIFKLKYTYVFYFSYLFWYMSTVSSQSKIFNHFQIMKHWNIQYHTQGASNLLRYSAYLFTRNGFSPSKIVHISWLLHVYAISTQIHSVQFFDIYCCFDCSKISFQGNFFNGTIQNWVEYHFEAIAAKKTGIEWNGYLNPATSFQIKILWYFE